MSSENPSADPLKPAGSPPPGEPAFLVIGKLRRPHGIRGEILMEVFTDFPERIRRGDVIFVGPDHTPLSIHSLRWSNQMMLLSFKDYSTPEEVGVLRNQWVYVSAEGRPELEEGEYYHHQLIGLQVREEAGELLGEVTDILETGSNDVLVVRTGGGREILLPVIESVILEVDLNRGEIRAHLLPGLID